MIPAWLAAYRIERNKRSDEEILLEMLEKAVERSIARKQHETTVNFTYWNNKKK